MRNNPIGRYSTLSSGDSRRIKSPRLQTSPSVPYLLLRAFSTTTLTLSPRCLLIDPHLPPLPPLPKVAPCRVRRAPVILRPCISASPHPIPSWLCSVCYNMTPPCRHTHSTCLSAARSSIMSMLRSAISVGRLEIEDYDETFRFGSPKSDNVIRLKVLSGKFWTRVFR